MWNGAQKAWLRGFVGLQNPNLMGNLGVFDVSVLVQISTQEACFRVDLIFISSQFTVFSHSSIPFLWLVEVVSICCN